VDSRWSASTVNCRWSKCQPKAHESILDQRVLDLSAYERLNATFMQLLLADPDHVVFTDALAAEVGHPVVLEEATRQVVAYSGNSATGEEALKQWERYSRIEHDPVAADLANGNANEAQNCTRKAVVLRGQRWGWLHVLHGGNPVDGISGYALDRAADGIAIALLGARETGATSAQRQNALVNRLLLGDISGESFVARALRFGGDLRDRALVAVFVCKDAPATHSGEGAIEELCRSLHVPAVTRCPAQARRKGHQSAAADVAHLPFLRRKQISGCAIAVGPCTTDWSASPLCWAVHSTIPILVRR
jgi:purine catabolism regulator